MIALASEPVKTHIVEADYYYRVSLRGTAVPKQPHIEIPRLRSEQTPQSADIATHLSGARSDILPSVIVRSEIPRLRLGIGSAISES